MLGVLALIQMIPADNVFLPALYNFQKIMHYTFLFLLFHFIIGVTLYGTYKAVKLVITNRFVMQFLSFLVNFDDENCNKMLRSVKNYTANSFS